jgi:hypothetical protein
MRCVETCKRGIECVVESLLKILSRGGVNRWTGAREKVTFAVTAIAVAFFRKKYMGVMYIMYIMPFFGMGVA